MSECENCGTFVSERYARVFSRDGNGVECCPACPDKIRRNGEVREARLSRHDARAAAKVQHSQEADD